MRKVPQTLHIHVFNHNQLARIKAKWRLEANLRIVIQFCGSLSCFRVCFKCILFAENVFVAFLALKWPSDQLLFNARAH